MNDPATAEVWQTTFKKVISGMAQEDNKMGQKGTTAMFLMTHKKIAHAYREKKFFTFANPVIDYRPQKDDPNRIHITAIGNLITYDGELSICMADIHSKIALGQCCKQTESKIHVSQHQFFYLTAALEYFEYMKMPLSLFTVWILEQYCTFDPNWQPGPWISRISCSFQ